MSLSLPSVPVCREHRDILSFIRVEQVLMMQLIMLETAKFILLLCKSLKKALKLLLIVFSFISFIVNQDLVWQTS